MPNHTWGRDWWLCTASGMSSNQMTRHPLSFGSWDVVMRWNDKVRRSHTQFSFLILGELTSHSIDSDICITNIAFISCTSVHAALNNVSHYVGIQKVSSLRLSNAQYSLPYRSISLLTHFIIYNLRFHPHYLHCKRVKCANATHWVPLIPSLFNSILLKLLRKSAVTNHHDGYLKMWFIQSHAEYLHHPCVETRECINVFGIGVE